MQKTHRVGARGITVHNGRILLNVFDNGAYYNTPGGGVEEDESLRVAAEREVWEESGVRVTAGELLFVLEYNPADCNHMYGDMPTISFYFACSVVGDDTIGIPTIPDVPPENPTMVSTPVWVDVADLPNINLLPHVNDELLAYIHTGQFVPNLMHEPLG